MSRPRWSGPKLLERVIEVAAFQYPSTEEILEWGAGSSEAAEKIRRAVKRNGWIFTLSAIPPFAVLLALYVLLLYVGPALRNDQYWSAVAGLAILIGAAATGWRTLMWKRRPRVGLDYYCATSIYYLRLWTSADADYRRFAQQQLAVMETVLVDPRHVALYAATRDAREMLTSALRSVAGQISARERQWLRLDTVQAGTSLIEAIGGVLVRRDFRGWAGLEVVGEPAPPVASAGEVGSAPLGRIRDKIVDKLAEALSIAAAASILAALPRVGLPISP